MEPSAAAVSVFNELENQVECIIKYGAYTEAQTCGLSASQLDPPLLTALPPLLLTLISPSGFLKLKSAQIFY